MVATGPDAQASPEPVPVLSVSVFCDDIRMEATGKLTLVGCYPGSVIIATPGQPIDRLCIYTRMMWGNEFDPAGLRLRVDLPAQEPNFMQVQSTSPATQETPGLATCVMNLRFAPLRVGDRLRVSVDAGGRLITSGDLTVVPAPVPAGASTRH
jgi:hypothetical protein